LDIQKIPPQKKPSFWCSWPHQTEKEAFLANLLFPIELEEPWDSLHFIYDKMRLHTLLAFSCKYKSPLAMIHLARIIDYYFEEKPKSIDEFQKELLTELADMIDVDDSKPYFDFGEILRLKNLDAIKAYKMGSEQDFRCFYEITKDKDAMRRISIQDPLALIYLADLEDDPKEKLQCFINAGKNGVPYGWFRAGTLPEDNCIEYLTKAATSGIASAYLTLGEYYSDLGNIDEMITLFESSTDCPAVFVKLGDHFKYKDDPEKAGTFYLKNILTGFRLIDVMDLEEKFLQESEKDLELYFLGLKRIISGDYPNLKSQYPTEFK
jgi:hypothetical protein